MTAPQPATPGSDSVRAQIAEVLAPFMSADDYIERHDPAVARNVALRLARDAAAVLVPLVDRLLADAKAEALEEARRHACCAADEHRLRVRRDRAAAYRTNPSKETDRD